MCGLFGIIPSGNTKDIDGPCLQLAFFDLASNNDLRGGHSWGVWGKNQDALKGYGYMTDRIRDTKGKKTYRKDVLRLLGMWDASKEGNWLCGHTRFATHGAQTLDNAHPFNMGRFMLAHNGIVDVEGMGYKDHPVDSARIGLAINKHGFKEGMSKVSGSCGLIVTKDEVLWLYRHNQMLHYAKGTWGWMFSSDKSHLERTLRDYGMKHSLLKEVPADRFVSPWTEGVEELEAPCSSRVTRASWSRWDDDADEVVDNWWGRGYSGHVQTINTPKTLSKITCEFCGTVDGKVVFECSLPRGTRVNICPTCYKEIFDVREGGDDERKQTAV